MMSALSRGLLALEEIPNILTKDIIRLSQNLLLIHTREEVIPIGFIETVFILSRPPAPDQELFEVALVAGMQDRVEELPLVSEGIPDLMSRDFLIAKGLGI